MSATDQINAFLASLQDLMVRAGNDPALAERLLEAPRDVIAGEVASPIPAGIEILVARDETGELRATARLDEGFEGELDESVLEEIAGGRADFKSSFGSRSDKTASEFRKATDRPAPDALKGISGQPRRV